MGNGAILGVVAMVVVAGVGLYWASNANSADVTINVHAGNFLNDLDILIYVDGNLVGHGKKGLNSVYMTHTINFPIWESSKTVEIKAVGQGGIWGTKTASTTLIVVAGQSYNVNLTLPLI